MKKNAKFSSKLGFVAAAAGSAVGLYNMWRFPYEVGQYGGACFLFVYLACVMLVGYPLVVAELALGRNTQANARDAYIKVGKSKHWGWIGFSSIILATLILSFYNVVTGWILGYCFETLKGSLTHLNDWGGFFADFRSNIPSNLLYTFIICLAGALIVRGGVQEGLERWSKILMPIFVFMLIGLIVYALTLEGAWEGVKFYLVPNFQQLSWKALYASLGQSFLSISVGLAILITYGGYLRKKDDIANSAAIIVMSDTTVSFLAGMMLFPFIFHQNMVPDQGAGLVFISLPQVFQSLGPLGVFVGAAFFMLFILAALTSSISMLEGITKYVEERYGLSRNKAVWAISIFLFALGIPTILSQGNNEFFSKFVTLSDKSYSFFSLLDSVCSELAPTIICFVFSLFVAYRWKTSNMLKEVEGTTHQRKWLAMYLRVTIGLICPIVLGIISVMRLIEFLH